MKMWPSFSYMSKEESIKSLRQLELEAYSLLVSVFRAQGPLTQEKRKVLRETGRILHITIDRHKTEVRRAVNHEKLNEIAYHIYGPGISSEDWCQEGRRVLPMLQRISPQTLHPIITDTFPGCSAMQQPYQEVGLSSFEGKKLSGEGTEILFKKAEKMDYSQAFTNESDAVEDPEDDLTPLNPEYPLKHRPLVSKSSFYRQSFGGTIQDPERMPKNCPTKKLVNKNQHLMIVSNTQTIPTNSILHKTLSVPVSKVTKLNLDKFKIVSSSSHPSSIHVSSVVSGENTGSLKYKFFTGKTGKKVIPLSQLQMLNHKLGSKGIKVLPLNSKLFGKNITMTRITPVPGLKSAATFSLASTGKKEEAPLEYENNIKEKEEYDETEDIIYQKNESSTEKPDDFDLLKNTEKTDETISEIKTEEEGEDFGADETEVVDFRSEEIESEELRTEETESKDYIIEETNSDDFRSDENETEETESKCVQTEENSESFRTENNERKEFKTESNTDEILNKNEPKNRKTDDDLAALMEIDSSEFIEPELKDTSIVKK